VLENKRAPAGTRLIDAYEQIYLAALGRSDEFSGVSAVKAALKWVLCSVRPLNSEELMLAISVQPDGKIKAGLSEDTLFENAAT
jgi:hypothetical protein